ncbi:hypothetical protein MPTK1_4g13460 [Marchantia polymorpha subsp. ruderalis]|uniref:GDSL esterase/lipase n=2 Tax=Marchantia polymorpha TaxID=3197 RepID=A0AAF6B9I8_MARPO|nr:hypothetical protein MARPO_0214s0012 [Marchantia polymorpha]BBN08672.1 hypothetical protein Mp_4g13460 [Marchantia polymorpha subsp. ruderalis]|eukprot:PTQ27192.1 hypothetical protein MARPO_0214s0012 [Marchantia polymorpha]
MAKPAADIRWRLMLVCAVFAAGKIGFLTPVNGQTSNRCPRAFFNFGTSLTDTGNILNEFPFSPEITKFADPENPPYGDAFFRRPAKRYCNGRLIPDFISLAFDVPLLDAYTSPTVFNFRHGLNFAGDLVGVSSDGKSLPLFLPLQIKQFIRFKSSALTAQSQVECLSSISSLPPRIHFQEGLYTLEFGSSDIRSALQRGLSTASILQNIIPAAVKSVLGAVQILYQYEARNFLIYNIFPQGCSPQILTLLDEADLTKDDLGCIAEINQLDEAYNSQLFLGLEFLRASLPDTNIILFDFYNATIEMLRNPSEYGFDPNSTLSTCCGAAGIGDYNFNPNATCATSGSNKCADPDKYIFWDGIHFTESFYRIMSKFILTGQFLTPGTDFSNLCRLNFTNFVSSVTYEQVYGGLCNVWYA